MALQLLDLPDDALGVFVARVLPPTDGPTLYATLPVLRTLARVCRRLRRTIDTMEGHWKLLCQRAWHLHQRPWTRVIEHPASYTFLPNLPQARRLTWKETFFTAIDVLEPPLTPPQHPESSLVNTHWRGRMLLRRGARLLGAFGWGDAESLLLSVFAQSLAGLPTGMLGAGEEALLFGMVPESLWPKLRLLRKKTQKWPSYLSSERLRAVLSQDDNAHRRREKAQLLPELMMAGHDCRDEARILELAVLSGDEALFAGVDQLLRSDVYSVVLRPLCEDSHDILRAEYADDEIARPQGLLEYSVVSASPDWILHRLLRHIPQPDDFARTIRSIMYDDDRSLDKLDAIVSSPHFRNEYMWREEAVIEDHLTPLHFVAACGSSATFRRVAPLFGVDKCEQEDHKYYLREPLDILVARDGVPTLRWMLTEATSRLHNREHLYERAAYDGNMELFQMLCDIGVPVSPTLEKLEYDAGPCRMNISLLDLVTWKLGDAAGAKLKARGARAGGAPPSPSSPGYDDEDL